jgi:hypothetical protein
MSRPDPFQHLRLSAVYQEAARERLQRRIDPLKVLNDLRSHGDIEQVGDSVRRHALSRISVVMTAIERTRTCGEFLCRHAILLPGERLDSDRACIFLLICGVTRFTLFDLRAHLSRKLLRDFLAEFTA